MVVRNYFQKGSHTKYCEALLGHFIGETPMVEGILSPLTWPKENYNKLRGWVFPCYHHRQHNLPTSGITLEETLVQG